MSKLISIERLSTFLSDLRNLFATITRVAGIEEKIPTQASSSNQLADKAFVNSSVQTATANFRGNYLGWGSIPTTSQSYPPDYAGGRTPTTNDYMVVANTKEDFETPVAKWEQGGNYEEGQFVVYNDDPYGMFRAKHHITDSQIFPLDDQENWEELPYEWYDAWYEGGTWRFKYTGNWDNNGISGWIPEYQVNEEPLTAAQIAALNSNITAALTSKLQGLPSKPVDTSSQSLTDGEKTQARTNIGAASSSDVTSLSGRVANVEEKIPTQASAQNQLADKNFVNSSIQTATATFRGIRDCWCALGALGSAPDNNDYAVLQRCNDYIYEFNDDPDEPHNIGDIFGYGGIVYRVVTDFYGSFDETKCEKIGELALYGGEPDGVGGVQRYYSYSIEGKTYFRIADWDTENPDGLSPSDPGWIPANWVLIEGTHWEVDTPLATWRWKYTGPSGSGVYAWEAEYKINDAPLTAAQLAALNSDITKSLTTKLQNLPSKPVDTAAQTLTYAEKAQARTNIGATAPEVFWAVYGSTTHAEVAAAVSAGKVVMMRYNNKDYNLETSNTASNFYFSCLYTDLLYSIYLTTGDVWGAENYVRVQKVGNLVTSWQSTPDNTHYPAEKLVYDSMFVKGVISQTQTWTGSAATGYDYVMSDIVFGNIPKANIDLFEGAGATFNETTGYFELNGLTDLSYEEMQKVMRYDLQNQAPVENYKLRARTNLAPDVTRYYQNFYTWNAYAFNHNDSSCEILNLGAEGEENISLKRFFYVTDKGTSLFMTNNHSVKSVYGVIDLENVANINAGFFQNCESLERIKLYGIKVNLSSLAGSPRLTAESVAFAINNAGTATVIITLHATAYARAIADADVQAALQAHTNVSLASA